MSKEATLQVRIDEALKTQADKLFGALGLSTSEAVRLFVAQSVNERRLPFTPQLARGAGDTSAFGKLSHYARPELTGDARAEWLKEKAGCAPKRTRDYGQPATETVIVDETVLLHYLLDDDPRPSAKARRIVASGRAQAFPETIAATVGTLEGRYRVPRSLIGTVIAMLADDLSLSDAATVRLAARLYGTNRLTFTECLLSARNVLTGHRIESFNRSLSQASM